MRNKRLKPAVNRDRIIESVYHVVYIGKTTRNLHEVFSTVADKLDENEKVTIRFLIQSNVMIATISLLDEMDKFLFKCHDNIDQELTKKVKSFKYIIAPILNSIDKWKGLRKFRNNVLAHNFRIDSDNFKSVFLNNELKNYVIPTTIMDLPQTGRGSAAAGPAPAPPVRGSARNCAGRAARGPSSPWRCCAALRRWP